jgi:hypothetical protein
MGCNGKLWESRAFFMEKTNATNAVDFISPVKLDT